MKTLPQRPFLIGKVRQTLTQVKEYIPLQVPAGGLFLLQYILAYYVLELEGDPPALITPPLFGRLYSVGGEVFDNEPWKLDQITSPNGNPGLNGVTPINYLIKPRDTFVIEITGQASGSPAFVSITAMGIREGEVLSWP